MTPTEREQMMCDAIVDAVYAPFIGPVKQIRNRYAYPFCDTSKCPFWRGFCSRDPACDD